MSDLGVRFSFKAAVIIVVSSFVAVSSFGQSQRWSRTVFLRARAGISSYIGDNSTTLFNAAAFRVDDKAPYSFGLDIGYRFSTRWSTSLGAQMADYPIITRFGTGRDISRDPTTRQTFEWLFQYALSEHRLAPYLNFGFHMTFGDVKIYEARLLREKKPLNTQSHYVYGPVLGVGIDYALQPGLSVFADITSRVTLMDDSVDGRLPLGPPQPANLKEFNRFGTFDLLSALQFGITIRPFCGFGCRNANSRPRRRHRTREDDAGPLQRSRIRISRLRSNGTTNVGYYYALGRDAKYLVGVETGLIPRSIFVRFTYPDGTEDTDTTYFTGAFLGLSARVFPFRSGGDRFNPHLGATLAVPAQFQLIGGIDYNVIGNASIGLEARYVSCPTRSSTFYPDDQIVKSMKRNCEYTTDFGVSLQWSL